MTPRFVWTVPCHNEEARIDRNAFVTLVDSRADVDVLFVDDGSDDRTLEVLGDMVRQRPNRLRTLSLESNQGKAEAVRRGLLDALANGAAFVGYLDADLATPLDEMSRLSNIIVERGADVVLGSRVSMLGRRIERTHTRHYLGRVFASAASVVLGLNVYDTQCGAKIFRASSALSAALATPFVSRWVFDVELLGRLLTGGEEGPPIDASRILEEPLLSWRDIPGSKLSLGSMAGAPLDLVRVARDLARRSRLSQR